VDRFTEALPAAPTRPAAAGTLRHAAAAAGPLRHAAVSGLGRMPGRVPGTQATR
jgi:hypothetical protein